MDLTVIQKSRFINNFDFNQIFSKEIFPIVSKYQTCFTSSGSKPKIVKLLDEYYNSDYYKNNQNLLGDINRLSDLNSRYKYELSK